jgi:hypothetical protein
MPNQAMQPSGGEPVRSEAHPRPGVSNVLIQFIDSTCCPLDWVVVVFYFTERRFGRQSAHVYRSVSRYSKGH